MKQSCKFSYLLLWLSVLFYGCSTGTTGFKKVQQAYALLNSYPDSALAVLAHCNRSSFTESETAFYNLAYYMAQDKSGLDVGSDSLLRYSYIYYNAHPDDSLFALCNYYMGRYYTLADSMKKAKDCYLTAARVSEENGDLYTQYLSTEKLSRLQSLSNPREALALSRKAYDLFCLHDSSNITNKVYLLINIGNCYNLQHLPDSSIIYMQQALEEAISSGDSELIGDSYHAISSSFLNSSQTDLALQYAQKAWSTVAHKEISLYNLLSSCYLAADSLEAAKRVINESMSLTATNKDKYIGFYKLSKIGFEKNGDRETQNYVDSSLLYLRKLYFTSELENEEYLKDKNELTDKEEFLLKKQIVYLSVLAVLVVFTILLLLLYFMQKKTSRKLLLLEQEKSQMEALRHQAEMENERLVMENREHLLLYYKKLVLSKIDFSQKLNSLRNEKTANSLTEVEWQDIEVYLNEISPSFIKTLKSRHPDLREKDLRFCMLIKLGFNNNELLRFYERGLQAIKQRLLNLKPVLGIEGKDISTRDYICNIV